MEGNARAAGAGALALRCGLAASPASRRRACWSRVRRDRSVWPSWLSAGGYRECAGEVRAAARVFRAQEPPLSPSYITGPAPAYGAARGLRRRREAPVEARAPCRAAQLDQLDQLDQRGTRGERAANRAQIAATAPGVRLSDERTEAGDVVLANRTGAGRVALRTFRATPARPEPLIQPATRATDAAAKRQVAGGPPATGPTGPDRPRARPRPPSPEGCREKERPRHLHTANHQLTESALPSTSRALRATRSPPTDRATERQRTGAAEID